jgi:futalosine hydrolase
VDLSTVELLLIPTGFEWRFCQQLYAEYCQPSAVKLELCGWGPIHSGIRTMMHLGQLRPQKVWLIGIAGSLSDDLHPGQAYEFSHVAIEGIGVGSGDRHVSSQSLKWSEKFGDPQEDVIELASDIDERRQLLTVCSASADRGEAERKRRAYPLALAEDMESYAVASACGLAQTSLNVVRGISNRAGDRDPRDWRSEEAMIAAFELAAHLAGWNSGS